MIEAAEVATKEFLVGVRGYVREEVNAYLRALSEELIARDETVVRLTDQLAAARGGTPQRARVKLEEIQEHAEALVEIAQEAQEAFATTIAEIREVSEWLSAVAEGLPAAAPAKADPKIRIVSA